MPKVVLYTSRFCSYCMAAKALLLGKDVAFDEIDVTGDPALRQEMIHKAMGKTSVPQIWIGNNHVGGFTELHELDRAGKLDPILVKSEG